MALAKNGTYGPDAANTVPFFAFADDTDTDVTSAGQLLGLSCSGEFELQTGYFDNTASYKVGDPLIKSATAGSLAKGASFLSAVEVVGIVSNNGKENIVKINSEATPDAAGAQWVINLYTRWKPAQS